MTKVQYNQIGLITFVIALLMLAAGCQTDKSKSYGTDDFFPADGPHRASSQFRRSQAAAGARADSTLRAVHFDRNELNSLGRAKLDLMLVDDESIESMTIYVVADESDAGARRKSVTAFLTDKGLTASQIAFADGENPGNFHPVAPDLANMSKTDSGSTNNDVVGPMQSTEPAPTN